MTVFMTALASGALPAQAPSASQAILDRAAGSETPERAAEAVAGYTVAGGPLDIRH
jgi:hypothetical protein